MYQIVKRAQNSNKHLLLTTDDGPELGVGWRLSVHYCGTLLFIIVLEEKQNFFGTWNEQKCHAAGVTGNVFQIECQKVGAMLDKCTIRNMSKKKKSRSRSAEYFFRFSWHSRILAKE